MYGFVSSALRWNLRWSFEMTLEDVVSRPKTTDMFFWEQGCSILYKVPSSDIKNQDLPQETIRQFRCATTTFRCRREGWWGARRPLATVCIRRCPAGPRSGQWPGRCGVALCREGHGGGRLSREVLIQSSAQGWCKPPSRWNSTNH